MDYLEIWHEDDANLSGEGISHQRIEAFIMEKTREKNLERRKHLPKPRRPVSPVQNDNEFRLKVSSVTK